MPPTKKPISNYTLLNRWLYDGSKTTKIPEDVLKDKSIGQTFLIYFFQYSHYNIVINKLFNNYGLFSLEREDIFKFVKECVLLSGYKQQFISKAPKTTSKLYTILKNKYPFLKKQEINLLIENIDNSDQKDDVYEMFGFYKPKKKKTTVAEKNKIKKIISEQKDKIELDELMENFQ